MASVSRAATPAAVSAVDPVDLVNVPAGQPVTERYPGPVDPSQYEQTAPLTAGGVSGPPYGSWQAQPFTTDLPEQAPGGGYQDTSWATGHDAPETAWDSSAGAPFAPSGALDPLLHGEDTGGVWRGEHVTPAAIGILTRHTSAGQTWNRLAPTQSEIGLTEPNGRTDLDQQQWHDPDGYSPWLIPYAERPILNNLAYEATASGSEGGYAVAGQLPDRSPYLDYAAVAYSAPADPAVALAQQPADNGIGGGWV